MSLMMMAHFRYPSYVEDIMGPMCFDYGFGPFRWICTSGKKEDLEKTDDSIFLFSPIFIKTVLVGLKQQYKDNMRWITEAKE